MILKKATYSDIPEIWNILQDAIEQRRLEGSDQWQNGYPNEQTVHDDISQGYGYIVEDGQEIKAYAAIIFGEEPAYNSIVGQWFSNEDCVVIHRVATAKAAKGTGVATRLFTLIEELCLSENIHNIKVDTNFDNVPMLKILNNLGYTYCGEVFFHGAARKAFEKIISLDQP